MSIDINRYNFNVHVVCMYVLVTPPLYEAQHVRVIAISGLTDNSHLNTASYDHITY
jgi:hypothetical protein